MLRLKYLFSTYPEFHACWFSFCKGHQYNTCQTYKSNCKNGGSVRRQRHFGSTIQVEPSAQWWWMDGLGFYVPSTVFQYFSHFETMEGWTWKALCSEAPFRFGKNLASSGIRTRDPVIRGREPYRSATRTLLLNDEPDYYYIFLLEDGTEKSYCNRKCLDP